jgi:hypothetical protein
MNNLEQIVKESQGLGLDSLEGIAGISEINTIIISVCKASPKKFFTAKMFVTMKAAGTNKQYSNALWGLSTNNKNNKNPVLVSPSRGYYTWITKKSEKSD